MPHFQNILPAIVGLLIGLTWIIARLGWLKQIIVNDKYRIIIPSLGVINSGSLGAIIRSYKSSVTRWCRQNDDDIFRWQPRFYVQYKRLGFPQATWTYEYIIRDDKSLNNIRQYIIDNPAKWTEDQNYVN